jgi:hypothetical protein
MSFSIHPFGTAPFSAEPAAAGLSFSLSPGSTSTLGAQTITATFNGADSPSANPFAVVSGPGSISGYAKVTQFTATFTLNVSALTGPIVISDTTTGTQQSITATPVAPNAPTNVVLTNNGDGTVTATYTQATNNGGSAIIGNSLLTSTGGLASALSPGAPIIFASALGVPITAQVRATNAVGNGPYSSASNSVIPTSSSTLTVDFHEIIVFPTGTTIGAGLAYEIRHNVSGSPVAAQGWTTTGMVAVPEVTPSATQPPCYAIDHTVIANNADGSFSGILIARSHSSAGVYVAIPLNIQARKPVGATVRMTSVAPFLSTDVFTTAGFRAYQGTTALESRRTTGILPIPEITNGFFTDVAFAPASDGSFYCDARWDQDNALKVPERLVFPAPRLSPVLGTPRAVSVILTDASNVPTPSLTGLRWAWFDQASPDIASIPADKGSGATTNGSGVLSVTSVNSALSAGSTGWMEVYNSTSAKVAAGPVVLS